MKLCYCFIVCLIGVSVWDVMMDVVIMIFGVIFCWIVS